MSYCLILDYKFSKLICLHLFSVSKGFALNHLIRIYCSLSICDPTDSLNTLVLLSKHFKYL